jgi:alcohol dehydrogenase (cytochrome c)
VFVGQLDANVVALDIRTGGEVWKTPIEDWHNGYSITSAPLYFDGIVYSGISGGELGTRGRLTALEAKTGKILWRAYTIPSPGEIGSNTWPSESDAWMHGGGPIWNTPALDPQLGLIYFAVGNAGPDYDGSVREGDNLFTASILALKAKTGEYVWHFQEVHHDLWDYDAASPVVLFDTMIDGQPRKGIAEAGKTGWVYLLDRTDGKPLIGIDERPVPQEPRQKTAKTQPYPRGDATVPQCADPQPGIKSGCIFQPFWDGPWRSSLPVKAAPTGRRCHTVRTPAIFTCPGRSVPACSNDSPAVPARPDLYRARRKRPHTPLNGTFTAIDSTTNKIAWQQRTPNRMGGGSGSTVTAGGLLCAATRW